MWYLVSRELDGTSNDFQVGMIMVSKFHSKNSIVKMRIVFPVYSNAKNYVQRLDLNNKQGYWVVEKSK